MTTGADWLDTARRVVDTFLAPPAAAAPATPPATEHEATAGEGAGHADTCRWCPVCQAVAVARGERPEVTAALADLLTTTAEALRTFAESVPTSEDGPAADAGEHAPEDAPEDTPEAIDEDVPPSRPVQRIDIG
jgi:RecB family exonuclease